MRSVFSPAVQRSLFGHSAPGFDEAFRRALRITLEDGAWVEQVPEWVAGHASLYDGLLESVQWQAQRRLMYERVVDVPRLLGRPPETGPIAAMLDRARAALSARYGLHLDSISVAHYRDGRDSVAMHGDKMGALVDDTIVAVVSLGEPRRFLLKPVRGGPSRTFSLGWGDLLVMGGTCQRSHVHGVPKAVRAGGRMSIMFRPIVPEQSLSPRSEAQPAFGRAFRVA